VGFLLSKSLGERESHPYFLIGEVDVDTTILEDEANAYFFRVKNPNAMECWGKGTMWCFIGSSHLGPYLRVLRFHITYLGSYLLLYQEWMCSYRTKLSFSCILNLVMFFCFIYFRSGFPLSCFEKLWYFVRLVILYIYIVNCFLFDLLSHN